MTPPTSRTWGRRGSTPVILVRGRSQRRFSIAALCCYQAGERSRLVYRPKRHTDHKNGDHKRCGCKSFAWTEYRDLRIAAHQQLDGPIVLIRDHLNVHQDRRMRAFIDAQDRLTAYHLPPCTPDLNPVESIWSVLRRTSQANTVFTDPDHLHRRLRHGLRHIKHRSDIINRCLTTTGLTLTTPRLQPRMASTHGPVAGTPHLAKLARCTPAPSSSESTEVITSARRPAEVSVAAAGHVCFLPKSVALDA